MPRKFWSKKLFSLLTVKKDDVRFAVADAVKLGFYGETDLILSTDIASEDGPADARICRRLSATLTEKLLRLFESSKESKSEN